MYIGLELVVFGKYNPIKQDYLIRVPNLPDPILTYPQIRCP